MIERSVLSAWISLGRGRERYGKRWVPMSHDLPTSTKTTAGDHLLQNQHLILSKMQEALTHNSQEVAS